MVKIKHYVNPEHNNKYNTDNDDIIINSSEIAKIYLNCPFPTCKNPNRCTYYQEKIKEIKGKKNEI